MIGTKQNADSNERRISRFSRRCARIVLELRNEGNQDGAARFEALAIEIADDMRRGRKQP